MFRFSIDADATRAASTDQLATHNIQEDEETARAEGGDERYYRAENASPESVEEAVVFVQGVFRRAPNRVWIDGEEHAVTAGDTRGTGRPGA